MEDLHGLCLWAHSLVAQGFKHIVYSIELRLELLRGGSDRKQVQKLCPHVGRLPLENHCRIQILGSDKLCAAHGPQYSKFFKLMHDWIVLYPNSQAKFLWKLPQCAVEACNLFEGEGKPHHDPTSNTIHFIIPATG